MFADVILPLPLEGLFTYSVPQALAGKVRFGVRVTVPLGAKKTYTAIVARTHDNAPQGVKTRDITGVADDAPALLESQYKLWQWIADYYMAPLGDVYKAAMPAGMKAEEGYRPKTELCVRLAEKYRSERALHIAFDMLARAGRQRDALAAYLSLSHWDSIDGDKPTQPITELTREELMNASHARLANIKDLVDRGILETYEREVGRLGPGGDYRPDNIRPLNAAQQDAYNAILFSFLKKDVTLLHGVTSSGKTEIYIHLIRRAIERGEQVLYLLPEIALTVQMMERLRRVFGRRLAIYHSRYSDAERVEIWRKQLSEEPYDVVLGARSALFLPFARLGLVIIDEEHETSFKQQEPAPRYHARSAAIMLAHISGAKTLLGTATPSIETYHNAATGKYGLVELTSRYQDIELPEVRIVDVKDLRRRKMMSGPLSPTLLAEVRAALERGEQAILFQNRRGFAPVVECRECGWTPRCANCDVSLTMHLNTNQLTCHYCGFTYRVPTECPACGSKELRPVGYGTEKIEEVVRRAFPEAAVARMDLDTTRTRNAYSRLISDFAAGRTNILIGTQMISKGLDFPGVSVVGILDADAMMNIPDFRAHEHAYTMMAQVSGRAGRKGKRGLVILQTRNPGEPLLYQVARNDYAALYRTLTAERREFAYPPYTHLVYVYLKHTHEQLVNTAAIELASRLRQWFGARTLGPDKPPVAKIKTLNIRKIVIKIEPTLQLARVRAALRTAQTQLLADKRYASLLVYYDVDPV